MPEHSRTLIDVNLGAAAQRFKEAFARERLLSERPQVEAHRPARIEGALITVVFFERACGPGIGQRRKSDPRPRAVGQAKPHRKP